MLALIFVFGMTTTGITARLFALLPSLGGHAPQGVNPAGGGRALASQTAGDKPSTAPIIGSGHPASKDLSIVDFDSLEIVHPFRVEVIRADRFGVTITADDNVLEHVKALKEGSMFKIALAEGKSYRLKAGSLKATVRMPALAGIGLGHGARGTVLGFKSERSLKASVSHGSMLEGEIEAGDVALESSHGSTLDLKGKARDGRLVVAHGSKLNLADLTLRAVEIEAGHGSTARFNARSGENLKVTANHGSTAVGSIEAGDITVETGHGSLVILKGRARQADLEANHGSTLALGGLALRGARADLGQSSSATVNAGDTLDYQLDDSSSLRYVGKPKIGKSGSSRSSSARSIGADEAAEGSPSPPDEPARPDRLPEGDIFISTVGGVQVGEFAAGTFLGSGHPASKVWNVVDFTRLKIGSTFRARIIRGDGFKVTTSSDDNILEHVHVIKNGKTLRIGLEPGGNYRLVEPLKVEITLPILDGLDVGGASRATLGGFRSAGDLQLKLHGASTIDGSIEIGGAEFEVDGASTLALSGSAKDARLSIDGASHLRLGEFVLYRCAIDLDGASTARLAVRSDRPFTARLSGASLLDGIVEAGDIDLDLDGASRSTLRGSSRDAKIKADGASNVDIAGLSIDARRLSLTANSASTVSLRGKSESAVLEASGSSHLRLGGLAVGEASVKLSGSSDATLEARGSLKYELSTGSGLEYSGDPTILSGSKSGGATIRRRPAGATTSAAGLPTPMARPRPSRATNESATAN